MPSDDYRCIFEVLALVEKKVDLLEKYTDRKRLDGLIESLGANTIIHQLLETAVEIAHDKKSRILALREAWFTPYHHYDLAGARYCLNRLLEELENDIDREMLVAAALVDARKTGASKDS